MTLFSNKKRINSLEAAFVESLDNLTGELYNAFNEVRKDIISILDMVEGLAEDSRKQKAQLTKDTVISRNGDTITTVSGRLKAIADHLGISFVAVPKEVTPAKIDIVKAKKGKK